MRLRRPTCDRCGSPDVLRPGGPTPLALLPRAGAWFSRRRRWTLCGGCRQSLEHWLHRPQPDAQNLGIVSVRASPQAVAFAILTPASTWNALPAHPAPQPAVAPPVPVALRVWLGGSTYTRAMDAPVRRPAIGR
jgi:hypothetical protein